MLVLVSMLAFSLHFRTLFFVFFLSLPVPLKGIALVIACTCVAALVAWPMIDAA